MTTRSLASITSRWLPSMSKMTRVRWNSSTGGSAGGVSLYLNLLCATVRKVRPSESAWATVGVSAWTRAFCRRRSSRSRISDRASAGGLPRGRIGPQRMPGGQVVGVRQAAEEVADVGVGLGIGHQHGVVDVPGLLPPRIEDHLLPGVVGVQRGDHALDRVVEEHRADADAHVELEAVGVGEERLVLADGLALVVEDRPAAAHPARADIVRRHLRLAVRAHDDLAVGIALGNRPRLGLDLLLDLAAEAVGVGEAVLDLRSAGQARGRCRGSRAPACRRRRAAGRAGLSCAGRRTGRRRGAWWRADRMACGSASGFGQVVEDDGLGQVGLEAVQRVALGRRCQRFAHHRRAHHHAQRIEGHRGAVAVGVHHQPGLQHAVVVAVIAVRLPVGIAFADGDAVAQRIAGFHHQQVVGVVGDEALGADRVGVERVAVAVRQEEVLAGVGEFLRRRVGAVRANRRSARRESTSWRRLRCGRSRAFGLRASAVASARPP